MQLDHSLSPHIIWQLLAYVLLTSAEVMISITCLEFSYTQAPKTMKSFVMAFYFLSVAVGNLFTSAVNFFIQNEDGTSKLAGANYFWFFTGLMFITAALFLFVSNRYKENNSYTML
jgi:POT family proton-dependent oligopeptide transporter